MTSAWMIRAGSHGEREAEALKRSLVILGWHEMPDLAQFTTRRELYAAVRATYPHRSSTVVANWTGQLWRFARVIEIDDFVVVPLKTVTDRVAIGRIAGGYRYRDDAEPGRRHTRTVVWIRPAQPRSEIQQDLRYSLGSLLTVCQLQRNGAARRIAALAETGVDPGPTPEEKPDNEWKTPDDLIATAVDAEQGIPMTVRSFLAAWGVERRTGATVEKIHRDLAENGLTTVPAFTEGGIDAKIALIRSGVEDDDSTEATDPEPSGVPGDVDSSDDDLGDADLTPDKPFTLRFGNLVRSDVAVGKVRPDDTIALAQTRMLRHDYSQLAVIDDGDVFRGAISWESIAMAALSHQKVRMVEQAMRLAPVAEYGELLIPRIGEISRRGFVFVRSADGRKIDGIVTAADLTNRFGEIVRPFTMIEECERRLNRRVSSQIPADVIARATHNRHKDASTLTFGSYTYVLRAEENFKLLDWPLDHDGFVEQITEVTRIRNKMMHFSPDPIPVGDWGAIDGLLAMLRAVDRLP